MNVPVEDNPAVVSNAVLIAGPTASGKSALAMELARKSGRIIVNADSMQVYCGLRILTARPDAAAMEAVPHYLYGHVEPGASYSTGAWLRDVEKLAATSEIAARGFIFVGGTGLYFSALTKGLAPMPDVPMDIRNKWRGRLADEGTGALHALLANKDEDSAARLDPADGQRIVRALEVLETSGRSISWWQGQKSSPLVDIGSAQCILLGMNDAGLSARIDRRFRDMVKEGALQEVRDLLTLGLDWSLPVMKAIGVRQISAFLKGRVDLEQAIVEASAATRQYAKRQRTWFRNRFGDQWERWDERQLKRELIGKKIPRTRSVNFT